MAMWKKGESGNPAGRPKAAFDLRDLARTHTTAAVNTLLAVMRNTKAPPAARVSAATAILDRGYGRPAQTVHQHVSRHIDELSDAELIAIATGGSAPVTVAERDPDELDQVH